MPPASKVTYADGSTPRVCIIGAGFSGICAAVQLQTQLGLESFTIFESGVDFGGTWLSNTYPGCACDIQSHLYSYSFEPNPKWSSNYAPQPEIWAYLRRVARKHNLYAKAQFGHTVKSITWDDSIGKWATVIASVETSQAGDAEEREELFDVIINAVGVLRAPKYPSEFAAFKGTVIHSAEWNSMATGTEIDGLLDDKVVAVIGSGASAIQIIPSIVDRVRELHVYQRRAPYVFPRAQFEFPEWIRALFAYFPFIMALFRWALFMFYEVFFGTGIFSVRGGRELEPGQPGLFNALVTRFTLWNMSRAVGMVSSPGTGIRELEAGLTPNYTLGCKRVLISSDYYPAMAKPNVTLHTGKIVQIGDQSLTTADGSTQKVDSLILCTGFLTQDFFAPMKVTVTGHSNGNSNANGHGDTVSMDVLSKWKAHAPETYYGIMSHGIPNLFMILGPNTASSHNSNVFMIECQVTFIVNLVREMMKRGAGRVDVNLEAQRDSMAELRGGMKETIWEGNCGTAGSWYTNERGQNTVIWPRSCMAYWVKTRKLDANCFDFSALRN